MADLIEALHNLARQRTRGDTSPLLLMRALPGREGDRISHLPISQRLSQAWIGLTGQPFRQHQSLSLSALRRGEPFALIGGGSETLQTLHLLAFELLRGESAGTALLLAPDEDAVAAQIVSLGRLAAAQGAPLRVAAAQGESLRSAFGAHLVVAAPAALHERMLRHHDRAWQGFWSRLQLILIADAHRYAGVAAGHLAALLLRARRLAPADPAPLLGATLADVQEAGEVLAEVAGQPWRQIRVDDVPLPAASLALWRSGGDRAREAVALALGMQRAGASVHVIGSPLEAPLLRALLGAEAERVSVGLATQPAQVQILVGVACGAAALRAACASGALLTVMLLGDDPAERTIARLCARDPASLPLFDDPPPAWLAAPANAYVVAQHLVCAASERPISAAEADAWQAASIIARLEAHQQLAPLPEAERAWQPLPGGGDAYAGFDLGAAGAPAPAIRDDQGRSLAALDPAAFDRWAFLGAALPPLRGGYRVLGRDESDLSLTIRAAGDGRRTFPLRRCTVRVRDRRERRDLRGHELAWGRVVVDEEIYGYREVSTNGAPVERALNPALATSWSAPAAWVDLPLAVGSNGQQIGWSLAAAVAVRTVLALTDVVPAYDGEARRIYLVDAQPGGNGLALWLFAHIEELLPLAYDIALDCRSDALLEPLARADMDWLLALLGGPGAGVRGPGRRPEYVSAPEEPPRREEPPPRREEPPPRAEPRPRGAPERSATSPRRKKSADKPPSRRAEEPAEKPASRRAEEPARPAPAPPRPPAPTPPAPEPEPLPDAAAMVERLRRMREQRERNTPPAAPRRRSPNVAATAEPRFAPGDTVFCMPWGNGLVKSSRVEAERELLIVHFEDHGELLIDTAVSAVRLVRAAEADEDDT